MNIRRCWLSLGLGVRIDNGLRRAIWRGLHARWCLTLWAFSRRSPRFGVHRPCWSLRLVFALVFRRNRRPGAVRRRWCWFVDLPSLRRHHLCTGRHEGIATYQTLLRKGRRKLLRFGYLVWVITPSLFRSVALNFSAHSAPTVVVLCCAKAGMADNNTAVKMAVRTVLVSGWKAYHR
jgi:hypothetical protein